MLLQKQLKELVKGNFVFRNTRYGSRVITKEMADFSAIKSHFDDQRSLKLHFTRNHRSP
jgi:hypothetical protein